MHTIKDLEDHFGWSYTQTRKRIMLLQENFSEEVKGGKNQKYLVTDNGLKILERLKELEEKGINPKSALTQIKEETEKPEEETNKAEVKTPKTKTNYTKKYVKHLEEENQYLKQKLDEKEQQLEHLLPTRKKKRTIAEKIKSWLGF